MQRAAKIGSSQPASYLVLPVRIAGVFGAGAAGTIVPSTLSINPQRLLANVARRTRKLGRLSAQP
jgi:hypothetical protein